MSAKRRNAQTSEVSKTAEAAPSDIQPAPYELPDGWTWTAMPSISQIIMGQSPPGSTYNSVGDGLPFYQGKADFGELYPTPRKWCSAPRTVAQPNDILISVRAPVGPTNLANEKCCFGRGLAVIRARENIQSRYLLEYLRLMEKQIADMGQGSTFTAISRADLETIHVPVAPLPDQRRIVAKIERMFAESRTARDALERVPPLLKRFRQSVLAAAFRGQLTERDPNDEPASALLERIRAQRMQRLPKSSRLRKSETRKPENTPAPPPPDTSDLPELPEGWVWVTVNDIGKKVTDGTHVTPKYVESGVPFISVKDVFGGNVHFEKCKYITREEHKRLYSRCNPEFQDVLITKSGTIGRIAVVRTREEFSIFVSVALVKPQKQVIVSAFLAFALENYINGIDIEQDITGGVIKNLHIEDLKKVPIQLPPLAEQRRIVARIEALFAQADAVERAVAIARRRADKIDQSILSRAFRGEL